MCLVFCYTYSSAARAHKEKIMNQGFTLIELLVVVLIIGVLAAVALPQYQTAVERSRATEGLTLMAAVRDSAERYHSQHDAWPTCQLDVDIPINENCSVSGMQNCGKTGGKNFCIGWYTSGCEANGTSYGFCINAVRSRNSHAYILKTAVKEDAATGTYSSVRTCSAKTANDTEATEFCNAITGGHNSGF